jgi:AMP phosphorylase
MEVLAPVTIKTTDDIKRIVKEANACIVWGGTIDLAPADDKIIRVEHPLAIEAEPLMLSSILAKKKSEGAKKVLIDIPLGKYSKVRTRSRYKALKKRFIWLGKKLGMDISVMESSGKGPIGKGVGPVLEARDVLWALRDDPRAPSDLVKKSLKIAGLLFKIYNMAPTARGGVKLAKKLIHNGHAYAQMKKIIEAQGGDPEINPDKLKLGKKKYTFHASKRFKIKGLNDDLVAEMAKLAGAPRDKQAGVYLHKQIGEKAKVRDPILTIYSNSNYRLEQAKKLAKDAVITS